MNAMPVPSLRHKDALADLMTPALKVVAPEVEHSTLDDTKRDPRFLVVPIDRVVPDEHQVRRLNKNPNSPQMQQFAVHIHKHGIKSPIEVRPTLDGLFRIVFGERRFLAAKLAGFKEITVKLADGDESSDPDTQLIENLVRSDLHPLDTAGGVRNLLDRRRSNNPNYSVDDLSNELCKGKAYISQALAVADKLSPDAKLLIEQYPEAFQSLRHLYEASQLAPEQQLQVLNDLRDHPTSADELRRRLQPLKTQAKSTKPTKGGRPTKTKGSIKRLSTANGAAVIVRFRRSKVSDADFREALKQARDAISA